MDDDAVFIENSFRKHFSNKEGLVIYGLGKNTKTIIERCPEYNIVGLMDRTRTGEMEWGLPILSMEQVNALGVRKIIIIATAANVPIIFRRIENECRAFGIDVYDINGEQKQPSEGKYQLDHFYSVCTFEKLKGLVDACDVISFDIFDTLLVRDVLMPTDIFEIVEKKNKNYLPKGFRFAENRINCERKLYSQRNPTIFDIYEEIKRTTGMDEDTLVRLRNSEIEEERRSLFARERMKDIVFYAIEQGKKVCCTSDMYLTKEILVDILKNEGYPHFDNVFVSCEVGVPKMAGLFKVLKNSYSDKKILHIGDNYDADIVGAKKYGIDEMFQIASIYKMISDSAQQKILTHDVTLEDRCEMGRIFSHLYNDPFIFSRTGGKCEISDNYSLGYFFIEPMLSAFTEWMLNKCKEDKIDILLLGSRDGFIIQELLDIRKQYMENDIAYKYFYASRHACTLAGVDSVYDVKYAMKMSFDGLPEEMLKRRFELSESEIIEKSSDETSEDFLEKHISIILNKSKIFRDRYRKYIEKCNVATNNVGFFDFVSSGTCQLWLENIWPEAKWIGYYFIRNHDMYKNKLEIKSYFEPKYVYERQSKLYKNYIFMENIMTSFEPTLIGFLDDGEIQLEFEKREQVKLDRLKAVHRGILDAYEDRMKAWSSISSRDLADDILDMLNGEYSVMKADFFEDNVLDDSFCNRSFDLKKMLDT